ncbi:hypothetical protein G6F35_010058 [Rhizopus arrhizus]|nr:hypothetical protein G6F35_010058 [Rhizopus arrhizus]
MSSSSQPEQDPKTKALNGYRRRLLEHRELDAKLKEMRLGLRNLDKEYDKSEDDIKALQSVGQVIGEVLKQLDDERCSHCKEYQWATLRCWMS